MKVFRGVLIAVGVAIAMTFGLIGLGLASVQADIDLESDGGGGLQGVPAEFRTWILKADNACDQPSMTPSLLAAQLYQESKFRPTAQSNVGAQGPAQFMPGTWDTWGRDDDHNGTASPWDIGDAVMSQGRMMCSLLRQAVSSGYPGGPQSLALAGYNAGWGRVQEYRGVPPRSFANGETYNYVQIILSTMKRFEGTGKLEVSGTGSGPNALRKASTLIGTPYSYGGGGPQGPTTGFCDGANGYQGGRCSASSTVGMDCSSLVQYAYWPNAKLPRTAESQYRATSNRPVAKGDLQPGDLLFWSNSSGFIYHVALYAGDDKVLHAPRTGRNVEVAALASAMPAGDYLGATRP